MATFSNRFDGSIAIPDNNATGITNGLAISGVPTGAFLREIKITLNITHTYIGDLNIYLIDPDGNQIELSTLNGGTRENFVNAEFLDSATTLVTSLSNVSGQSATGLLKPEQALSTLYPGNINGIWSLKVSDTATIDTGTLTNWSIDLSFGEASRSYSDPIGDSRSTVSASRDGRFSVSWDNSYSGGNVANLVYAADGSTVVAGLGIDLPFSRESSAASTFLGDGRHVLAYTRGQDINLKINSGPTFATTDGTFVSAQAGDQVSPMVAELSDGNLIVAYADLASNTMQGRIFNTTTNTFGAPITLSAPGQLLGPSPNPSLQPANLIALRDGGFAVTFSQIDNHRLAIFDNAGGTVLASRYVDSNQAGQPQTPYALTQLNDGNIMIVGVSSQSQISATVLTNTGGFITGFGTSINTIGLPSDAVHNFRATTLLDGRVMVVSSSLVEGAVAGSDIWGAVLKLDGSLDGKAFKINGDNLAGTQSAPDIATLADGRVVVTWTDHSSNSGDIMQQIIDIRSTGVTLIGQQSLNETWLGSRFADTMSGGLGNDAMDGGAGDDRIYYDPADTIFNVKGGADTDTLVVSNLAAPISYDLGEQGFERAEVITDDTGSNAWSQIVDIYNAVWVLQTKQVSNDDNTRNFLTYDQPGSGATWSLISDTYNALNQLTNSATVFDDQSYNKTTHDLSGAVWSLIFDTYDNQNRQTSSTIIFDDQTYNKSTYDLAGANWSLLFDNFNALNQRTASTVIFDDQTYNKTTYDLTGQTWSFVYDNYTAQNQLATSTAVLDDGSFNRTTYDLFGGNWANFVDFYNTAGVRTRQVGTFDDGQMWEYLF